MSTLEQRVADLAKRCEYVGWPVTQGGKHLKVAVPGYIRPIALPGTPGSARAITNLEAKFRGLGLDDLYSQMQADRKQEAKEKVAATRNRANKQIAQIDAAAQPGELTAFALAKNGIKVGFEEIGPVEALALLKKTAEAEDFKQRPVNGIKVTQYAEEMKYGDWQEYMPDGVICVDPEGVLLNGQKRMHAIIESGVERIGFMVARDVPRSFFAYFDMAQTRSASDTFAVAGLPSGSDIQSAVRLAMKYESMLRGTIERISWSSWNKGPVATIGRTNAEALNFFKRRPDLGNKLQEAKALFYQAKFVTASAVVFEYYANKAWPDRPVDKKGFDPLESYILGIRDGEHLRRTDPAYLVRDWSLTNATERRAVPTKRETYLFVAMRYWHQHAEGASQQSGRVYYQQSWPMPVPFHPDGEEIAIRNSLK